MSETRILVFDPRNRLGQGNSVLTRPDWAILILESESDLLTEVHRLSCDPVPLAVIFDGVAPGGSGPDLVRKIHTLSPRIPPIVMVLVDGVLEAKAWSAAGANASFTVPFLPEELGLQLSRWLVPTGALCRSILREDALRKFFAMYAHDLKNPLAAIGGYCEIAQAHPLLPEEAREDLTRVHRQIELLNTMSQGLLDMVRGPDPFRITPKLAHLTPVVKEAVEMLRLRAGSRGISFCFKAEDRLPAVRIDSPRIIEALANVLDNAIKFSPDHATIWVVIASKDGTVEVSVEDEGPGIPLSSKDIIFERFTPAAALVPQGNLGLGLSIARDIVEQHDGTIRAEPRSPKGTRITISIPQAGTSQGPKGEAPTGSAQGSVDVIFDDTTDILIEETEA